ncbi:FAD/NAD(P)-binding domain-containing protein [Poronia punctata]|nr:FAD/NAD(P)-binding domain-containing protein [Poronia punctata]
MAAFRVIILGAGPVGLFTANALAAAGIDYIILERQPEVLRYRGALLVVWPPFLRSLDQLGLYEAVLKYSTSFDSVINFTNTRDEPLYSFSPFKVLEKSFGYPTVGLSRSNLIRVLYENLPARETKVRVNARAINIENLDDGVRVHLADGSVVDGSIVIGADGVHSVARDMIQRSGGLLKPTSPMSPNYLTIFGHTRCDREDLPLAVFTESHGPGIASQSTRLHDSIYFTVVKRLDAPATERIKSSGEDMEKMVKELPNMTLFPGVKLADIWSIREKATAVLLHQEEGIAEKWHHGRIVLVGDAAHKMTSVLGQGAQAGVQSATVLVNAVRAMLEKTNAKPTTKDVETAFTKYESSRRAYSDTLVKLGIAVTRFATWAGEQDETIDRQLSDADGEKGTMDRIVPLFKPSPVLDFVPFDGKHGTMPWGVKGKAPVRARL